MSLSFSHSHTHTHTHTHTKSHTRSHTFQTLKCASDQSRYRKPFVHTTIEENWIFKIKFLSKQLSILKKDKISLRLFELRFITSPLFACSLLRGYHTIPTTKIIRFSVRKGFPFFNFFLSVEILKVSVFFCFMVLHYRRV